MTTATAKQVSLIVDLLGTTWLEFLPEAKRTAINATNVPRSVPSKGHAGKWFARLTKADASVVIDALLAL